MPRPPAICLSSGSSMVLSPPARPWRRARTPDSLAAGVVGGFASREVLPTFGPVRRAPAAAFDVVPLLDLASAHRCEAPRDEAGREESGENASARVSRSIGASRRITGRRRHRQPSTRERRVRVALLAAASTRAPCAVDGERPAPSSRPGHARRPIAAGCVVGRTPAPSGRRPRPPPAMPSARSACDERERLRHRGRAVVLVQAVLGGGEQLLGLAAPSAATSSAARPALAAASACGTSSGSRPRATSVSTRVRRHEHDGPDPRVDRGARRRRHRSPSRPAIDEAAEQRRRDVVGVALELGGQREQPRRRRAAASRRRRAPRASADAADDRRRGRAEPAGVRDRRCRQRSRRPGGSRAQRVERRPHRPDHEVASRRAARCRRPRPRRRPRRQARSTTSAVELSRRSSARPRRRSPGRGWRSWPAPRPVTGPVDERRS